MNLISMGVDNGLKSAAQLIQHVPAEQLSRLDKDSQNNSLKIQVSRNNKVLYKSEGLNPALIHQGKRHFLTVTIDQEQYRSYFWESSDKKQNIFVASNIHKYIIRDYIGFSVFYIILGAFIVLALLVITTLRNSLDFIPHLSKELSKRTSTKLERLDPDIFPIEVSTLIHELNTLFARVQWAFERNKRFSADAAHELRTPITALRTQAELALEIKDDNEKTKALENVLISVDRSIHVIQQLLTLSRLDHEEELNDVQLVNLETICAEIIAFLYPNALEKNIEVELDNQSDNSIIKGNDASLGILMRNLIDNAIRYTPRNGTVHVKITNKKNKVLLNVTDSGPGIEKEFIDKVFDRFFRVLGTKQSGSGLGLAIVKQIVELHHADIKLEQAKQHGLSVTVEFNEHR